MAAYSYKVKGLYKAPAQKVGELFEQLEHSGIGLSPESLLDASREEGTLLHDEFCWDDEEAAEKYRIHQAQGIIRCVVKVSDTDDEDENFEPVRAFVSAPGGKTAYVSIDNALTNEVWRKHLLESAQRDMNIFIAKYNRLEELASVIGEMKKAQAV